MLHKPFAILPDRMLKSVCELFRDFVAMGGLWGVLDAAPRPHANSPTAFLLGPPHTRVAHDKCTAIFCVIASRETVASRVYLLRLYARLTAMYVRARPVAAVCSSSAHKGGPYS